MTYASAGHPPPVRACHHDPIRLLVGADAPPLVAGLVHDLAGEQGEVLPAGVVLVAYSDDPVERHGANPDDRLLTLRALVDAASDPARGPGCRRR